MKNFIFVFLVLALCVTADDNEYLMKKRHTQLIRQYNQLQYLEGAHVVLPTKNAPTSLFELVTEASLYTKIDSKEVYSSLEFDISQPEKLRMTQNLEIIENYQTHTINFTLAMDLKTGLSCQIFVNQNTHPDLPNHKILAAVGKLSLPGLMECVAPNQRCGTFIAKMTSIFTDLIKEVEVPLPSIRKK